MASPARITIDRSEGGGVVRAMAFITAAEIIALGASTTGELSLWTIPKGATVLSASVLNGGTAALTLTTLTASIGITGTTDLFLGAETVFAANALAVTGVAVATEGIGASIAAKAVVVEFTGSGNLSTMTGGAPGGWRVDMTWIERLP